MARIAFFGTPDFAAAQFEGLISYCEQNGHTIAFAVCQPDRPKGRSQTLLAPPVKIVAIQHGIPVFQPSTLRIGTPDGDAFFETLQSASLALAVVVAYGRIIPSRMLKVPEHGFVNVHASLLPRWRGASPIQRALQAGDPETGVSIMDLVAEMDAGDVYEMRSIPIGTQDTAGTLTPRLAALGLETLTSCFEKIVSGNMPKTPQPKEGITFAPKIEKEEGLIDWTKSPKEIVCHNRAMDPWPQAFTHFRGKIVKLFGAQIARTDSSLATPGTVLEIGSTLVVKCSDGCVSFAALQLEGRSKMSIRDAFNGKIVQVGDQFSTQTTSV